MKDNKNTNNHEDDIRSRRRYSPRNLKKHAARNSPAAEKGGTARKASPKADADDMQTPEVRSYQRYIHILLCLIIIFAGILSVGKLMKWNKGTDTDFDPDYINEEYDVEALDEIFIMDPRKLEGHEDDGVFTILCLGNDVIADGRDAGESFCDYLAELCDAKVINAGFNGTIITAESPEFIEDIPRDAFSFYYAAESIASGDLSRMKSHISSIENGDAPMSELESLDMQKVDLLVIFYDASDMIRYRPASGFDPSVYLNISTGGSLGLGIRAIQEAYPFIRIAVMSPYYAYNRNDNGSYTSLATDDYGHGSFPTYLGAIATVTSENSCSFIDNYYGTINELNAHEYLTDNIHINSAGRKLLAERLVRALSLNK